MAAARTRTRTKTRVTTSTRTRRGGEGDPGLEQSPGRLSWAKSVIQLMSYNMLQLVKTATTATTTSQLPLRASPSRTSLLRVASAAAVWMAALLTIYTASYLQARLVEAAASGVAPTIDYSHNMRVLKLPKSTRPGEIIYRLRGSDGDPNSQLHFGVAGIGGRALLDIVQVPGSWNEADVYLRSRLDSPELTSGGEQTSGADLTASFLLQGGDSVQGAAAPLYATIYNLTIYVADETNKTTQVDSTILVTNDEQLDDPDEVAAATSLDGATAGGSLSGYETSIGSDSEQRKYMQASGNHHGHQANGSASILKLPTLSTMTRVNTNQLSPFIRPRHVFGVPENGQPGESIGFLTVRESDKSDLPVRFELRGRGSDHFGIRYVFGPRGQSRAELVLSQPVDFEKQNLFQLKVLALNAWTNVKYDTRNVATLDIVITVGDVQDTAPQFKQLPQALKLSNNMRPGDLVGRVHAEDGDYADQRPVGYALDASSPLSSYFTIDKQSGEIRLLRSPQELTLNQHNLALISAGLGGDPASGSLLQLTVFASELPDASSYDHLWPPMFVRAEIPLVVVDLVNEPPQFIGGWLTETSGGGASGLTVPTLRAFVKELTNVGQPERGGSEDTTVGRDSTEANSNGSPGQIVQWYTSKNHSATAAAALVDLGGNSLPPQDSAVAIQQQLLKASRGRPMVVDFGQGLNGTFELSLEGPDAHLFEVEPSYPVNKQTLFNLFVAPNANRSLFDFDATNRPTSGSVAAAASDPPARSFHVELVARDFGSPHRMATRLKCLIDLLDVNDNAPQFDLDLYTFSIFENAQLGQVLGSIRARDMDRLAGTGGVLSGQHQRVRYTALSGRDSHLFRLDQESGLITLEGPLDREKQDHYLLLAEARDTSDQQANYTKILVNVLDVNDNAPVFSQPHYDAVLLADGTFYQPLVVSATDSDEPSSANSQVTYEIIAGNQNDMFAIDSLSGAIYPTGSSGADGPSSVSPARPIQLPSILSEPILPFMSTRDKQQQPDQHGKILPSPKAHGHEIEETTVPTGRQQQQPSSPLRLNWPRSVSFSGAGSASQQDTTNAGRTGRRNSFGAISSLDLMQPENFQSGRQHPDRAGTVSASASAHAQDPKQPQTAQSQRGIYTNIQHLNPTLGNHQQHFDASKLAPVTTLVVRAHDFGIPIRSATCKVNIYNQALLSRSLSVILNGTAEQLEQRRELIERSFGALTGSRVQIESIDALSDSSSISVARLKLAIPTGHSLIDLTDLSSLMTAIDYKPVLGSNCPPSQQQNLDQFRHPVHYITTGDRIYPIHHAPISNISATAPNEGGGGISSTSTTAIFTDIQSFDHASNMLERKLLFYIIIVGICILALLVIWMIYFCCREDRQQQTKKLEPSTKMSRGQRQRVRDSFDESEGSRETSTNTAAKTALKGRNYKSNSSSRAHLIDEQQSMAKSASELNLHEQQQQQDANKTQAKTTMGAQHPIGNNLLKQQQHQLSIPSNIKPEHYSMYNGQVWFEQGGLARQHNGIMGHHRGQQPHSLGERRASSAPSAGGHSLDSGLHAIINGGRSTALSPSANSSTTAPLRGQFFPNTLGYAENLATIATPPGGAYVYPAAGGTGGSRQQRFLGRHNLVKSRGRVVPMAMLGPDGVGHDYKNEAFEPDLESGTSGLVMVPFVGSGSTRRSSHSKDHHHHHHHKHHHKPKSHSTSLSSASRTNSTRTLDEEDEIDHESVLLDSDQELLGFDSTGTPIIATRTRHKVDTDTSLILGPDSVAPTGASSPAATVIHMGQERAQPKKDTHTGAKQKVKEEADRRNENGKTGVKQVGQDGSGKDTKRVDVEQSGASLSHPEEDGAAKKQAPDQMAEEGGSGGAKIRHQASERREGDHGDERPGDRELQPVSSTVRTSLDLMSELNERLSGGKQRVLRRQKSAAEDHRDGQPGEEVGQKQVIDQTAAEASEEAERVDTVSIGPSQSVAPSDAVASAERLVTVNGDESDRATATTKTATTTDEDSQRRQAFAAKRRMSETMSCQSTISESTTTTTADQENRLRDMKNSELLEKQSIFALTYSGLATDKLPS